MDSTTPQTMMDRTRLARIAAGFKEAKDMVYAFEKIGITIPYSTYFTYEKRTPIPHHLIMPFCRITNTRSEWLLNGEGVRERPSDGTTEEKFIQNLEEIKNYYGPNGPYSFQAQGLIETIKRDRRPE